MVKRYQRSLSELLDSYRDYLLSKVSKVRILGEANERELIDVFVELSIVDQLVPQQHAEFRGLMDPVKRQPFTPFAVADGDASPTLTGPEREEKAHRRLRPEELLRRGTKAIVTGAPGCGKTTLLKYLALQAQEKEKRLAVWLELKAVGKPLFAQAEEAAARDDNLIIEELWLKHVRVRLSFSDAEIKLLREHWHDKFRANELVVLLDGFDELQDEAVERSLNKCVTEFASAAHDNTLLISTRPYAQHKLGKERLQEMEIQPLNQRQIEAFLDCYYPKDAITKSILKSWRERSSLKELLHVPLLLGIILRLHRESRFTDEHLTLYETIVTDLVHELDRSKSVIRQFKIKDERLRLDFLKFVAFERLLRDALEDEKREANPFVFSYELLKEKARDFLTQERSSHNARDLANDVLATALLREVGADTFAFTHLTLQEYLAARAFVAFYRLNEFQALKIFCRAYHNPRIVEMEVLPLVLGAMTHADELYEEIERWPESMTFANVRLRARGWGYGARISQQRQVSLINRLLEFVREVFSDKTPYAPLVVKSFDGLEKAEDALLFAVREDKSVFVRMNAADALGQIGSDRAVGPLLTSLQTDEYQLFSVRTNAAVALGLIGTERAVDGLLLAFRSDRDSAVVIAAGNALVQLSSSRAIDGLLSALGDQNGLVQLNAAEALGLIRSERAIDPLLAVLRKHASRNVRKYAAQALGRIGSDRVVDDLLIALGDSASAVRAGAAQALGRIGSEVAVKSLITALRDREHEVGEQAAQALGRIRSDEAVDALITSLHEGVNFVQAGAAQALGRIRSDRAIDALLSALHHNDNLARVSIVWALGEIRSDRTIDALLSALHDGYMEVRWEAAKALGRIGSERALNALLVAMSDEDMNMRKSTAWALGRIGSERAVDVLLMALNDPPVVQEQVIEALGQIGSERTVNVLLAMLRAGFRIAAEALAKFEPEALGAGLKKVLAQNEALDRKKAAEVIGYYSNYPNTLQELSCLVKNDADNDVRHAAIEAAVKFARKLELLGKFFPENAPLSLSDNESRELFLVGEAFKVAAEAGHIFRPTPNSDWGIDGEIEFKNDAGEATGCRVYLQLKSGDSYLHTRKRDGKEIFTVKTRHANYWQSHAYPVLLVIRDSAGRIRWMNVTEYLRRHGANIKQIEFQGEPFTPESINEMRTRFTR